MTLKGIGYLFIFLMLAPDLYPARMGGGGGRGGARGGGGR